MRIRFVHPADLVPVYTANSMNCLTEAIGMGLKEMVQFRQYTRANSISKACWYEDYGVTGKEYLSKGYHDRKGIYECSTVDMALGCSTNTMLHLPAIAHEVGIELDLNLVNEVSARTPNLCHQLPYILTYMEDLNEAGGIMRL